MLAQGSEHHFNFYVIQIRERVERTLSPGNFPRGDSANDVLLANNSLVFCKNFHFYPKK